MNYTKAKAEVVNFSNEDVITVSAVPGHPVCIGYTARRDGCAIFDHSDGLCVSLSKGPECLSAYKDDLK